MTKTNGNDKSDELSDATAYATLMDNTYGFADGNGSVYKAAVDDINKAIKTVNDAKAAINANEVAYAKEVQAAAKKAMLLRFGMMPSLLIIQEHLIQSKNMMKPMELFKFCWRQ